jgi:hypothetical protein
LHASFLDRVKPSAEELKESNKLTAWTKLYENFMAIDKYVTSRKVGACLRRPLKEIGLRSQG